MSAPGARIGNFVLEEVLGVGGMGKVFLARAEDGTPRAVKMVRGDGDWSSHRLFIDEAILAIGANHPNVVRTYELDEADGAFFLVMEFVAGCSLAELFKGLVARGRALDAPLAAWIAAEVAKGLGAVHALSQDGHAQNVVHRDISPHNILLGMHGAVKIADFGVAKSQGRAERTSVGIVKGKPRYMAPEQARGESVDARTDLYALGLVVWQMLTMQRPFADQPKGKVLACARKGGLPRPSELAAVPPALDDAVFALLQVDPAQRPQSAAELLTLLAPALPAPDQATSGLTSLLHTFVPEAMAAASRRLVSRGAPAPSERLPEQVVLWTRDVPQGSITRSLSVHDDDDDDDDTVARPSGPDEEVPVVPAARVEAQPASADLPPRQPRRQEPTERVRTASPPPTGEASYSANWVVGAGLVGFVLGALMCLGLALWLR